MRQLLPGGSYAEQVEEIVARVAGQYGVAIAALRDELDSAPAAPYAETAGPSAGLGGFFSAGSRHNLSALNRMSLEEAIDYWRAPPSPWPTDPKNQPKTQQHSVAAVIAGVKPSAWGTLEFFSREDQELIRRYVDEGVLYYHQMPEEYGHNGFLVSRDMTTLQALIELFGERSSARDFSADEHVQLGRLFGYSEESIRQWVRRYGE
jgi:hypothetical protein